MRRLRSATSLLPAFYALVMLSCSATPLGAADQAAPSPACIWLEAERYASTNFASEWTVSSMGKESLLSGGQWLMRGVGTDELAEVVPAEGVRLTYRVPVTDAGEYRLWARVGWFHARADLQWRLGDGPWHDFAQDQPTTNLMEVGFFCEVSWADLGPVTLEQDTVLEIRYPKETGERRMLMALDCFAFVRGDFLPDGPFKPGQTYDRPEDRQAAETVYRLPAPAGPERSRVALTGLWQVARYDDPDMDRQTYEPVRELPGGPLRWMAFSVPGDPWKVDPLVFGHRLIYRTQVEVPEAAEGRGFKLHFSGTNWIVSVFVNGRLAGTHRGVWVPWDLDVTPWIRAGRTNELAVVVKGTYYAMDPESLGDSSLHAARNRPLDRKQWTRWVAPIYPSTKGDGDGYVYGIVNPVTLVCGGEVYTEDVFVQPSVDRNELGLETTLRNTSERPRSDLKLRLEAVSERTGEVEKTWTREIPRIEPGEALTVPHAPLAWENPRLWWPQPDPDLYRLRTTLLESGRALDVHEQLFGFREVTLRGTGLYINGVRRNFWNWVDVSLSSIERPEQWAEAWRKEGNRFMRFSHGRKITQALPTREQRLEFYDRNGIPGRLCTMIDGMFISYRLLDRSGSGDQRTVEPHPRLWENFREHLEQVCRAYRNHPSVILYQAENELVYINGMNLYGGDLDVVERAMGDAIEAARRFDPTRPFTVGGGGDLSGRLEINAPHYPTAALDHYPENAYTVEHYSTKIERWPWDRRKPWHVGECSFANHLGYGTLVAGSAASRSKQDARKAKAEYLRMLYGGYRWAGVHAFFPWDNLSEFEDCQKIFSDLCVIPRRQSSRLYGGRRNELLVKVMNDTLSDAPVKFAWSYSAGGAVLAGEERELAIEPGFGEEVTLCIDAPAVDDRRQGSLQLRLDQPGGAGFTDTWRIPILPPVDRIRVGDPVLVYERGEKIARWLRQAGQEFRRLEALDQLRDRTGLLIIGGDRLDVEEAYGPELLGFAVRGGRVICLEQQNPPAGSAVPIPLRPTSRFGGYAHPTALGTALFRDLGPRDLIDWSAGHPTYTAVYQKPRQGARVLAVAGESLEFAPLLEVPCGAGVMLLCQLRVGENLGRDPSADVLLRNLIAEYGEYQPASGRVAVFAPGNALLRDKLNETGVLVQPVDAIADALDAERFAVAYVDGKAEHLEALRGLAEPLERFTQAGGWVVLAGVDAAGMPAFNAVVDGDFRLRPFRMERLTLNHNEYPLAATLSDADVALYSPERIMHSTYWVSQKTFSGVIDATRDFAKFTLPPGAPDDPFVYQPQRDDHDPYNFVNGLMADDSWRYTRQIWVGEDGKTEDLVFRLRKPDRLAAIQIWNLDTYGTVNEMEVILDGDPASAFTISLPDATELTTFRLPEPVMVKETITLRPQRCTLKGRRNREGEEIRLVGINNLAFLRPGEPEVAIALDSAGGLVAFPRGEGGIFLNQLRFDRDDPKPENGAQKVRILGTILGNMGAGFRAADEVAVAGVNVRYAPLKLQEFGNAYLDAQRGERAWYGDPRGVDLELLPRGENQFADVTFHVTDYATAPTPDAIILGGSQRRWNPENVRQLADRVEGIPVNRTADVLFFLHTADVRGPVSQREREQMLDRKRPFQLPVVMRYVLHYADGQTAEIPVVLERHIEHWVQERPRPLEAARVAWQSRLEGLDGRYATLYVMQAANPRPDTVITAIDLVRTDQRAVPAVLGITLGDILTDR